MANVRGPVKSSLVSDVGVWKTDFTKSEINREVSYKTEFPAVAQQCSVWNQQMKQTHN